MAATNTTEPARKGRLVRRGAVMARSLMRLHPRAYLLATLGGAIYGGALVASSYTLGLVVDHLVIPRFEEGAIAAGIAVAGLVALFAIGMAGASATLLRRRMTVLARVRSDASLREAVVRRFQALPYEYHQRNPTGELLAHANVDPEAAADMPSRIPHAVGVLVLFFVAGVWIFVTDPLLAAVGLVVVPALVALNTFFQRRVETPTTTAQDRLGELSAVAHSSFDGALVVKVLGREESETARFGAVAEKLRDANIEVFKREATFDVLLESIPALTIIALLVCGAFRVDSGAVTPGTLFSFVNLFSMLTYPLRTIGYVLGNVPRSMAGYDRVRRVLDEQVPAPARGTSALPAGPLDLRADGVTFAHGEGNRILDDLSFQVKAGTTLAVAGPTGCGKTTLTFLLAGLLRPSAGSVRLGGVDVSDLAPGDVTGACATVLQDPFLFAGTIEENVLLGHEAADGEVAAALRLAGVAEFVDSLPDGLRTTVGERGVTLSGGQRQRVALARALVRSPRLLILDDATSAVDPTTEDRILRGIAAGLRGVTKVVVASRPSTLALADSVLYLEKNRPACLGTHEWLLAREPGYEDLVRAYESEGSRA